MISRSADEALRRAQVDAHIRESQYEALHTIIRNFCPRWCFCLQSYLQFHHSVSCLRSFLNESGCHNADPLGFVTFVEFEATVPVDLLSHKRFLNENGVTQRGSKL